MCTKTLFYNPFLPRLLWWRSLPFEIPVAGGSHISLSSVLMQVCSSWCVMFCTSAVTAFSAAAAHRVFGHSCCGVRFGTMVAEYCPRQVFFNVGWGLQSGSGLVTICWFMLIVFSAGKVFLNVQIHSGKRRIDWFLANDSLNSVPLTPLWPLCSKLSAT